MATLLFIAAALLFIPALAHADLITVSVRSLEQTVVEGALPSRQHEALITHTMQEQ